MNLPITSMMKESPVTPLSVTVLPLRVGAVPPPVALMVVAFVMLLKLIVHVRPGASADAAMAALISALRSTPFWTPPTVPGTLLERALTRASLAAAAEDEGRTEGR